MANLSGKGQLDSNPQAFSQLIYRRHDTEHNDTQRNDTQHKGFICDTHHR